MLFVPRRHLALTKTN